MACLYLTHKHLETYGSVLSTVSTDALVLKHQGISNYGVDQLQSTSFKEKCHIYSEQH